jgi:hypothetical protein
MYQPAMPAAGSDPRCYGLSRRPHLRQLSRDARDLGQIIGNLECEAVGSRSDRPPTPIDPGPRRPAYPRIRNEVASNRDQCVLSVIARSAAVPRLRRTQQFPPFAPGYFATSAKSAPVSRTRSAGVRPNTAFGDPAAAQISGYPCKSRSRKVIGTVACPTGGTPPTANPV